MSKVTVELNRQGVSELMKSNEMQTICKEQAENIAERADGNYEVTVKVGKNRCSATIMTSDWETYGKNLKENSLLKGM